MLREDISSLLLLLLRLCQPVGRTLLLSLRLSATWIGARHPLRLSHPGNEAMLSIGGNLRLVSCGPVDGIRHPRARETLSASRNERILLGSIGRAGLR